MSDTKSLSIQPLTWPELSVLVQTKFYMKDEIQGPSNAHTHIRLFDSKKGTIPDVTLQRDNHQWCPQCEKIQLYLESKRIPQNIKLVTMFCYGKKEDWYKKLVPSGMLPTLSLADGKIISESDDILIALENKYGSLQSEYGMNSQQVVTHRNLERKLFRAWCNWLCSQNNSKQEEICRENQIKVAKEVESKMQGDFMLGRQFSIADIIYIPQIERMNASLFYYKGQDLRTSHPKFHLWFSNLEKLDQYRGIMSDFSTHVHDLPPQMGSCHSDKSSKSIECQNIVDNGPQVQPMINRQINKESYPCPPDAIQEAVYRTIKHHDSIQSVNPYGHEAVDFGLRVCLGSILTQQPFNISNCSIPIPKNVDTALRYIKDRISVPRDMPIWSAMLFRQELGNTAKLFGECKRTTISIKDRYDQNPEPFRINNRKTESI